MKSGRQLNATAMAVTGVLALVTLVFVADGQPPPSGAGSDYRLSSGALVGFEADQDRNRLTNINRVMLAPAKLSRDDPLGACCDAGTGVCTDGVQAQDCVGPYMHWYLDGQCAELEPLCAERTGACCVDLVCVATDYEPECLALGGRWFPGESCDEFVCPADCEHAVALYDCYGDGWTGNTLDVLVNGVPVLTGITLASGPARRTSRSWSATA